MHPQLEEQIKKIQTKLEKADIEDARWEARYIIASLLQIELGELSSYTKDLTAQQEESLQKVVAKRCQHFPLDKIFGSRGFYKFDFVVSEDVLSPRPDTEILVEAALEEIQSRPCQKILDLGTGSGCIILSLLAECPHLRGVAIDASVSALEIAQKNAAKLGLTQQVKFLHSSWFDEGCVNLWGKDFDIIVSNPPYIPSADILSLTEEVKAHDPHLALDGGKDGLKDYRQIALKAYEALQKGGKIFLEVGIGQAQEVVRIFEKQKFHLCEIRKDYGGIERCIILKK